MKQEIEQEELKFSNDPRKVFGLDNLISDNVFTPLPNPETEIDVPQADPHYVYSPRELDAMLFYLSEPADDCLYICGPTGSGKTSLVTNVAAKLNWPLQSVTVSNATEAKDLIGHMELKGGRGGNRLEFEYGPLAKAMMNGEILLINEIDTMRGGQLTELNDVLDGRDLVVTQNHGEVIHPAPGFRVIATGNTRGNGENAGNYQGTRLLNAAFMDRFRLIEMDYQPKELLTKIVRNYNSKLTDEQVDHWVQLTAELREKSQENEGELSVPFSNRALSRALRIVSQSERMTVHEAVNLSYGNRLTKIEQEFVSSMVDQVFGEEKPITYDLASELKAEKPAKRRGGKSAAKTETEAQSETAGEAFHF